MCQSLTLSDSILKTVLLIIMALAGTGSNNYGVVIDAGSSGSRVHLFKWAPHDGTPSKLLNIDSVLNYMGLPLVKKSKPGTRVRYSRA